MQDTRIAPPPGLRTLLGRFSADLGPFWPLAATAAGLRVPHNTHHTNQAVSRKRNPGGWRDAARSRTTGKHRTLGRCRPPSAQHVRPLARQLGTPYRFRGPPGQASSRGRQRHGTPAQQEPQQRRHWRAVAQCQGWTTPRAAGPRLRLAAWDGRATGPDRPPLGAAQLQRHRNTSTILGHAKQGTPRTSGNKIGNKRSAHQPRYKAPDAHGALTLNR
jgi:hypothetical protein